MLLLKKFALTFAGVSLVACGMLERDGASSNDDQIIEDEKLGCVQGVVVNGLTGERLALTGGDTTNTVEVFARNKILRANVHVNGADENAPQRLKGEYFLCGVPMNNSFPLIARAEGYQDFEGVLNIPSTLRQRTPDSTSEDIKIDYPTALANIYLYPLGTEAQDLKFRIVYGGEPVEGATVQLRETGRNKIFADRSGRSDENATGLAVTSQIRVLPQAQKTDKDGLVTFAGSGLVLGGFYDYVVIPPVSGRELSVTSASVQVGVNGGGANLVADKSAVTVKLQDNTPDLKQIASTTESPTYMNGGKVVIWFNKDIEIVPSHADKYSASVSGAIDAKLFASGTSDSVKLKIVGNRLELEPNWTKEPSVSEKGITISYSDIKVRAIGDLRTAKHVTVSPSNVKIFDN